MILMQKLVWQIKCNVMTLLSVPSRTTPSKLATNTDGLSNTVSSCTHSVQSGIVRKYPIHNPCSDI